MTSMTIEEYANAVKKSGDIAYFDLAELESDKIDPCLLCDYYTRGCEFCFEIGSKLIIKTEHGTTIEIDSPRCEIK